MKQFILPLSILLLSSNLNTPANAYGEPVRFAENSPLAEGQWVKIGVDTNGIYEISSETLLSMGFADPSKVGVFGRGGEPLNLNFTDSSGNPLYSDELAPISVLHHGGKLYFYGLGPRNFTLNRSNYSGSEGCVSLSS